MTDQMTNARGPMRIGILTQWYEPEPGPAALPGVLARGLAARGHDVRVVTGFPNYPTGEIAEGYRQRLRLDERRGGVSVRRVPLYPSHDASAARRFVNYGSFAASATAFGGAALKNVDALWINYSPVTIGLPMLTQRALRRTPIVTHVLDLWPDTLFASGFAGSGPASRAAHRALERWCQVMYRHSDRVAYISPSVGSALAERGVPADKLAYAPMWADETLFHPVRSPRERDWGVSHEDVVLVYAGTLGRAQGLDALIRACANSTHLPLRCLIAGSGVEEARLRELAEGTGATNVQFLGRLPPESMPRLMATGDIHYVALNDHPLASATMPSKLQATMASARAILGSLVGDAAAAVEEGHAGWVVQPDDEASLAKALAEAVCAGRQALDAVGVRAREYYEENFSVERGVGRIERLLGEAAMASRTQA